MGHLGGNPHVEGSLGLLVHVLEHLLVRGHEDSEIVATLGVLHGVLANDTSQLVELLLELLVVLDDVGVKVGHALGEVVLGLTETIGDVETSITGLLGEVAIHLHLGPLALGDSRVQGSSLLGEHASGMGTVLLHGSANLVELSSVVVGHGPETAVVGSLVRVDEALELGILLKVLLVTLVTDADHAVHLGTHIGVDLSLSELVLVDNTGQLCDASVGLGNLLLHSGTERANADTEVSTGPGDTHGSLLAGVLDTLDVLRETLVVQSLGGVEGRSHARGGSLKSEIGVVTITLHLGANTTELGSGLSHDDLEPVVGLLVELGHSSGKSLLGSNGVGLDLGSALGNGLVGLLDASIDGRGISSRGTLLGEHLDMQCMSSMTLVSGNLGTDLGRFLNVSTVTCVLKSGSLVEPP